MSTHTSVTQTPLSQRRLRHGRYSFDSNTAIALSAETLAASVRHSEIGFGVLDTGCTRVMAGEHTVRKHVAMLENKSGIAAEIDPSSVTFRFGGGESKSASHDVLLPTGIAKNNGVLEVHVILDCASPFYCLRSS